ncbi:MAG: RES family NAD+ phosphorylase [Alphaproteobacteria bacterium]|nr:RES family NAD+ phosphorylase [Alphaproteobacteria bacterium]
MSSPTWTRDALSSSARRYAGKAWRAVEAQHRVSTAKLTDNLADQERLETLIEAAKPSIPPECRHLHYLLSTPFRYGAPYPVGSRFRRAGLTEGVFYCSKLALTAMTELAFWRLLFFAESPDTPWPKNPGEFTAFQVAFATRRPLDLTREPFAAQRAVWTHPTDYAPCQALAEEARAAGIEVISYASARSATPAPNHALLACRVFTKSHEIARQTWRIHFGSSGVRLFCEMPRQSIDLPTNSFAADPRTAKMRWER